MSACLVTNALFYILIWLLLKLSFCYASETEGTCLKLNISRVIGKKLSVFPLKSIDGIGQATCFRECQRLRDCLSANYNRKHFICELIGQKKSNIEPLISDGNFIHMDLPDIVDSKDKICGEKTCNNYSTCIHTSFNNSVCIATECAEPLPTLKNAIVTRQTHSPISATFVCNPGYTAVGTVNTIQCLPGGKWSSLSYSCHFPVDGGWDLWTEWGSCSKSCAGGTKVRTRSCNNPVPSGGGSDCSGTSEESEICNTSNCPIGGGWSNWNEWNACSQSCDGGMRIRSRSCNNPIPEVGGSDCSGSSRSSGYCNIDKCPCMYVSRCIDYVDIRKDHRFWTKK